MKILMRLLFTVSLLAGCKHLPDAVLETYGLPLVKLEIAEENLAVLNSTIWQKTPVMGNITIAGRIFHGSLHYTGASTIDDFKKNFEVELNDGNFRGHRRYRLSSQQLDPSMLRAWFGFSVFATMGLAIPEVEHTVVYLNGRYLGLYLLMEPIDEDFWAQRRIQPDSVYKAVLGNADFGTVSLQDMKHAFERKNEGKSKADLVHFIEDINHPTVSIEDRLNMDNVLGYLTTSVFLHNFDGFKNNFYLYREGERAPFNFVPWDLDRIYPEGEKFSYLPGVSVWGIENQLFLRLMQNETLRSRHLNNLTHLINQDFPVTKIRDLLQHQALKIDAAFTADRVLGRDGRRATTEAEHLGDAIDRWQSTLAKEIAAGPTAPLP